jgi:membrane-associated phospholipid phosphatase
VGIDARVADALHTVALAHPGLVRAMLVWSLLFEPNVLRVLALVLAIVLYVRHRRRLAAFVAVTMTAGSLLGVLLKVLIRRPRPVFADPVAHASGYAFPSGHALNVAVAAGIVLVLLRFRWPVWVVAGAAVAITGFCRVALGVHWTTDVVGGWLLGAVVVAVAAALTKPYAARAA